MQSRIIADVSFYEMKRGKPCDGKSLSTRTRRPDLMSSASFMAERGNCS